MATSTTMRARTARTNDTDIRRRIADAVESSVDLALLVAADGRCLYANAAARGLIPDDEVSGALGRLIADPEARRGMLDGVASALAAGGWSGESSVRLPDGSELPVSAVVSAVADRAMIVLRDLSGRYRAESALAGALLRSQDEERRRIGRELHDSTAQTVAALEIALVRMERAMAQSSSPHLEPLRECTRLAARCTLDLRTITSLLHPPLLDDLGLCNTLRWYVARFSQRSGVATSLDAPDDGRRWPAPVELALFRIVQESLANIHRYSGSRTAAIRLLPGTRRVELEVEDHGRGIPEEILRHLDSPAAGVGLSGMRQRVRELRGSFRVESAPGRTVIHVSIPTETDTP